MSKTKRQEKKKKARERESHAKVLKKRAIIREKAKLEKELLETLEKQKLANETEPQLPN